MAEAVNTIGINRHIIKTIFLCLSDPSPKVEKKFLKELMHFPYMTFMAIISKFKGQNGASLPRGFLEVLCTFTHKY